jgi:hypothetical protein
MTGETFSCSALANYASRGSFMLQVHDVKHARQKQNAVVKERLYFIKLYYVYNVRRTVISRSPSSWERSLQLRRILSAVQNSGHVDPPKVQHGRQSVL